MAYEPQYLTAPDGRRFLAGSPTEREQLLLKGYRLAEDKGEHEDHEHFAPEDEKAPESKPEPAKPAAKDKPAVQAVTPAVETSKPATK